MVAVVVHSYIIKVKNRTTLVIEATMISTL